MSKQPARQLPVEDGQVVGFLKALAHPKRFKMVQLLAEGGEMSCGALGQKFDRSQATISHHLKLLVDSGVLAMRQDGQHHFLSVNQARLDEVSALLLVRLKPPRAGARGVSAPGSPKQRRAGKDDALAPKHRGGRAKVSLVRP